jgi:hypothetical protein
VGLCQQNQGDFWKLLTFQGRASVLLAHQAIPAMKINRRAIARICDFLLCRCIQ